jgi:NitT/TauT family transport system substrate-binding protein
MVQNFLNATIEAWEAARKDPDAACQAHVKANPEIDLDDCMGNLTAVLGYIYTDFSAQHGVGSLEEGRMKTTYEAVVEAQSLDPAWDYHQAYDPQFIVKANGTAKP